MSHTFKPLKKEPAYVKVYNAVEADILSGSLAEGAPLPTEAELCEQFGVTRATVREGLRLLEQTDLVARGAAKRFYVKRPNAADVAASTSKSLALGGVTFREVWEALLIMYPEAARLAAQKLSKTDIENLRQAHHILTTVKASDTQQIVESAVAFFQYLASGLNNRVLLAMLQSLNMMIGASLNQVIAKTPNARDRILEAQEKIIDALEAKDAEKSAHWISKHIDDLKRGYSVAQVDMDKCVL